MKDDPLGRRFVRFTPSSTASDLATVGTAVIIRSTVGGQEFRWNSSVESDDLLGV